MGIQCHPGPEDQISGNRALATAAFTGMGILCGIEMLFFIGTTFRVRSGLYFWSLLLATLAQISVNISNILYFWVLKNSCAAITTMFSVPAYLIYVTFEFLVLYSRLHLLQTNHKRMRFALWAIIGEVALVEVPMAILYIGTLVDPASLFVPIYNYWWRVESIIYTLLDLGLSTLYIVQIRSLWNKDSDKELGGVLKHIVYMTIFLILIDLANTILGFTTDYSIILGVGVI
jgi:hypothetical protein